MEKIKNALLSRIEEISKRHNYYGFWKLGAAYVDTKEKNPYLYFPSEEYARKVLMEEFNSLTEDEFVPQETIDCLCFKDGDKLDIPFEVFKQKPKIHIEVPYYSDEQCGVSVSYKRSENEREVYERLFYKILDNARQKYINTLDGVD